MMLTAIKQKAVLFLLLGLFFSCRVTWVPEYNAQLEEQISKTAKANDKLYLDLLDTPQDKRLYENFKERYNELEAEINSIKLKNEARRNNSDFLVINKNLKDAFAEAKETHKTQNTLRDGEIKVYQKTLSAFWKPLYLAERGLKVAATQ